MFSFYSGPRIWCLRDVDFLPVGSFEFCNFPVDILTSSGVGLRGTVGGARWLLVHQESEGWAFGLLRAWTRPTGTSLQVEGCPAVRQLVHKETSWSIMSAQAMGRNLRKCVLVTWNQQGEELFFNSFLFLSLSEMILNLWWVNVEHHSYIASVYM